MKTIEEKLRLLDEFYANNSKEQIDTLLFDVRSYDYDSPTLEEYLQSYNTVFDIEENTPECVMSSATQEDKPITFGLCVTSFKTKEEYCSSENKYNTAA